MEETVLRIAEAWAHRLNQLPRHQAFEAISEAVVEWHWDDRTNLFAMTARRPEELALVLAAEAGSDDYLVVRFAGAWVVDAGPVDWSALEDEAFDAGPANSDTIGEITAGLWR